MRTKITLAVALLLFIGQACNTKVEKQERTESNPSEQAIFPRGEAGNTDNFTGNAYNYGLVANDSIYNTLVGNVYFEKSANSNCTRWSGISSTGGTAKGNHEKG